MSQNIYFVTFGRSEVIVDVEINGVPYKSAVEYMLSRHDLMKKWINIGDREAGDYGVFEVLEEMREKNPNATVYDALQKTYKNPIDFVKIMTQANNHNFNQYPPKILQGKCVKETLKHYMMWDDKKAIKLGLI